MEPIYRPPPTSGRAVHVFDMEREAWRGTPSPGFWMKPVRHDDQQGLFLGLIRFERGTRSGIHQHQGIATSFVADGSLTDYNGPVNLHEVGINYLGSTHDAVAYRDTILVSRLEAVVTYPPEGEITGVHAGSQHASVRNLEPDRPPEINVAIDSLPKQPTGIEGVLRQLIFDYEGTGTNHRMVQLWVRPETAFEFEAGALTEFWVRGGLASFNDQPVHADCFVICEAGARVKVRSPYGVLLLAWAEGRESGAGNLFGF
ncbi:MAG TPA: hypothetical protein VMZ74_11515 [Ramlibacter sp.]|nr:hypothetical protein [Ramlibacter sp.]